MRFELLGRHVAEVRCAHNGVFVFERRGGLTTRLGQPDTLAAAHGVLLFIAFLLTVILLVFPGMVADWIKEAREIEAQRREEVRKQTEQRMPQKTPIDRK